MYEKLEGMIADAGYENITDFWKTSGIAEHTSFETVRRAVTKRECTHETHLKILRHLGLPSSEIKRLMTETGDTIFAPLIGDGEILTKEEVAMLAIYRRISSLKKGGSAMWASILEGIGDLSGANVREFTNILRGE